MSSADPPAASCRKAEASFPAQRTAAANSGSCSAAAQLRHPDPTGTFTSCRELRESRRESGRAPEPPTSLTHSLGRGKRHSASLKPSITPIGPTQRTRSPSHTRGRGQAGCHSNQRAGGRALLLRRPHRGLRAAEKLLLPPPPPLSSPFPPGPMDEPLALRFLSDPGGREGEKEHGEQPELLCSQVGALGGGFHSSRKIGVRRPEYVSASCRDSLPQTKSFKLSRALWRSWVFIWFPPS